MSIGLLVPRSGLYPSIGFDLLDGLKAGLEHSGVQQAISVENTGFANNNNQIYAACEKFLMNGAHVVAGYVNPSTAESLNVLFSTAGKIFIALDPGYQIPPGTGPLSNVISLSLQGAFCCRLLASYAAANGAQKLACTASFYEAGYRSGFGFAAGLHEAGSSIVFNHITPLKKKEFTLEPLCAFLSEQPADAILASFCGDMADDFYKHAKEKGLHNLAKIYGSPFMAEETLLDSQEYIGTDVHTVVPWARELDNEENKIFKDAMLKHKRQANILSLLGWEAALVIRALNDPGTAEYKNITLQSPRGPVKCGTSLRISEGPAYLGRVVPGPEGSSRLLIENNEDLKIEEARTGWLENIKEASKAPMDTWHNAYLCIE